jgi:hypothetical protein
MVKEQKEVILSELADLADFLCQKPVSARELVNANAYQVLLRQHLVPGYRGCFLAKNMSFSGFSSGTHCQDQPAIVGGILDSGGFATIFTGLEFAGLLYLAYFEGKSPGGASYYFDHTTSVHRLKTGPASSCIHPRKLPLIPPLRSCW